MKKMFQEILNKIRYFPQNHSIYNEMVDLIYSFPPFPHQTIREYINGNHPTIILNENN